MVYIKYINSLGEIDINSINISGEINIKSINISGEIDIKCIKESISYIEYDFYIDKYDKIIHINSLYTKPEYRNKGYATFLLKKAIEHGKNESCSKVLLDDFSDNFNDDNNIYIKYGLKYIENGLPEMFAKI